MILLLLLRASAIKEESLNPGSLKETEEGQGLGSHIPQKQIPLPRLHPLKVLQFSTVPGWYLSLQGITFKIQTMAMYWFNLHSKPELVLPHNEVNGLHKANTEIWLPKRTNGTSKAGFSKTYRLFPIVCHLMSTSSEKLGICVFTLNSSSF